MRKSKERSEKDIQLLHTVIINKPATYDQLLTLYHTQQVRIADLESQIKSYQDEIRKWRHAKRRLRRFLGRYWQEYFPDDSDNKQWTQEQFRRWHDNLKRYINENWGYYSLDE